MSEHDSLQSPALSDQTARPEWRREITELVKMVVLFLVLFWVLKTFVIEGYEVEGPSMQPTLEDRQRILVLKLPHELGKLPFLHWMEPMKEGQIVVFDSMVESNKRYVKRVIARGPQSPSGNTVSATTMTGGNKVHVKYEHGTIYVNNQRVPEDYLTAQETQSPDVDETDLLPGEYYVMGDHRSVSKDSRVFHAVKEGQVVGRAIFRFWPLSKFGAL
jgi:signal peptidase I